MRMFVINIPHSGGFGIIMAKQVDTKSGQKPTVLIISSRMLRIR